jgi:hypothetical protein
LIAAAPGHEEIGDVRGWGHKTTALRPIR